MLHHFDSLALRSHGGLRSVETWCQDSRNDARGRREINRDERFRRTFFGAHAPKFRVDTVLTDGDKIDLGDSTLRVIHTPGHTPGSICLYEAQSKSLFSGDTVFPYGSVGRTDLPGGSSRNLIRSISRLVTLDVSVLYPGHGEVTANNVNEQIKQSLKLTKAAAGPE